jgi:hypothetical protein
MKNFFAICILFALAGNSDAAQGEVVLIGHYSNMKSTGDVDPHTVSGYAVSLFRQDETLFGSVSAATGALESAGGRIFDIEFNPTTRQLRFKAKYSSGWEYSKQIGPEGRRARDFLIFSGTLTGKKLAGKMVLKDGYQLTDAGNATYESMKRTKENYKPKNLEEWATFSYLDSKW